MKSKEAWKRWELALMLSVCITLLHGIAFGAPGVAWWGVIFPGLTAEEPTEVETAKLAPAAGEGVQIRFRLLDWIDELSARF